MPKADRQSSRIGLRPNLSDRIVQIKAPNIMPTRSIVCVRSLRYARSQTRSHCKQKTTILKSADILSVVVACSALSGFIRPTASDRHRVDALLRRSKRCGFCHPELPSFDQLVEDSEDRLFNKPRNNDGHVLHYLLPLPNTATEHYNLRSASSYNRLLPTRTGHLTDANFITKLLYKGCY